jgi:hypothetical protein
MATGACARTSTCATPPRPRLRPRRSSSPTSSTNSLTIARYDPGFWPVYRREKLALLEVLKDGDRTLWERAAAKANNPD